MNWDSRKLYIWVRDTRDVVFESVDTGQPGKAVYQFSSGTSCLSFGKDYII